MWSYCNDDVDYTISYKLQLLAQNIRFFFFFFSRFSWRTKQKREIIFDFDFSSIRTKKNAFIFDWWHWHCFLYFFAFCVTSRRLSILVPCLFFFRWVILGHKSNKELINNNDSEDYRRLSVFRRDSMNFMKTNISWIHNRWQINSQSDALCTRISLSRRLSFVFISLRSLSAVSRWK